MRWLDAFCAWLAATPVSVGIGSMQWITPLVQTVHILAIAASLGSILMVDLRVLGVVGRGVEPQGYFRRYLPWVAASLVVLLLSGSILIVGEPKRSLESPVFALKMGLLLAVAGLTLAFQAPLRFPTPISARPLSEARLQQGVAVLSLVIWTGIVFCGRWIAYAQG